jgi:hypothetical protein
MPNAVAKWVLPVPGGPRKTTLRALPTGSGTSRHSQPPESNVVHDYTRLGQHQIGAIACIVVRIGSWHVKHTGTTQRGETVSGSSCGGELSSAGRSAEMISDGCPDANARF